MSRRDLEEEILAFLQDRASSRADALYRERVATAKEIAEELAISVSTARKRLAELRAEKPCSLNFTNSSILAGPGGAYVYWANGERVS